MSSKKRETRKMWVIYTYRHDRLSCKAPSRFPPGAHAPQIPKMKASKPPSKNLLNPNLHLPHLPPFIPRLLPHSRERHLPIIPVPHRDQIPFIPDLQLEPRPHPEFLPYTIDEFFESDGNADHDVAGVVAAVRFDADVLQFRGAARAGRATITVTVTGTGGGVAAVGAARAGAVREQWGAGEASARVVEDFEIG